MKILALRLAEVGCFSEPVAIEAFDGGLNVLAGANEAGKSTLLAALRTAFDREHSTRHRCVEALRPYGGGAPLIEVEFAARGATWRLRKQYLSGRMAELRNLTTGQVLRGPDAEQGLAAVLDDAGGRSSLGLLWAGQTDTLRPDPPAEEATSGLRRAISAEIAATAGGSEARHVRQAVRAELERFVTAQRAQPRGDYDAALKARQRLQQDLELAVARRDAALSRFDRLADLKVQEAEVNDPGVVARLAQELQRAEVSLAGAREALAKEKAAAIAVAAGQSRLDLAIARRERFEEAVQQCATLAAEVLLDEDAARDHARTVADAEQLEMEARAARDAARQTRLMLDREFKAALAAEHRRDERQRHAELAATLAAAEAAVAHGLELRTKLDAVRVTPEIFQAMRREDDTVRRLEDRLAAAAPKLTLAYAPGGLGRITHAGVPVVEGTHIVVRPLVLAIEGIGTLEIAPGATEHAAASEEALARHRGLLAGLLAEAEVAALPEAEALLAERGRIEAEIAETRARLSALAPGGLTKLRAEVAVLARSAADDLPASETRARADIEAELDEVRRTLDLVEPAHETVQRAAAKEREGAARQAAGAADRCKRLGELERSLPQAAAREAEANDLNAGVTAAQQALNEAVRDLSAWRERVPEPQAMAQLEDEVRKLGEALRRQELRRAELLRTIASLEGELRADRNEDVEARVAELQGSLALAEQRVERFETDVAALRLLDDELRAEEMRSQDQYLKPITQRLADVVNLVFPGGDVTLAENFAPASLRRAKDREAIAALSEGTQEQLAVMVRLAFGRLLSDNGAPLPLILDDALVFSDDERIVRMFAALTAAARQHQLIVLTCRSRAFEGLAGHRLRLVPWRSDSAQAPRLAAG